jgi:hypothetical protein
MDRKTFIKSCCLGACSVAVLGVEQCRFKITM